MNKQSKFSTLLLSCLIIVLPALQAQERPTRNRNPEFRQKVSVNYLLVDVIVRNEKGEYVRNLEKEDFVLFENGKRKEVVSLDEYRMDLDRELSTTDLAEEGITLDQPPRNIIIFIDLFFSTPYGITQALRVTEDFVIDRIQPGDQVMLVSYFNGLRVIQPFTNDKIQIVRTLRESGLYSSERVGAMEAITGYSRDLDGQNAELLDELADAMDQTVDQKLYARHNARNYIDSLESLAHILKQIKGRKTLIMLSGGLNFELIDSSESKFSGPDIGRRRQGRPNYSSGMAMRSGSLTFQFRDAMETLNDSNVSIYTVNTSGLEALGKAQNQFDGKDSFTGANAFDAGRSSMKERQNFLSSVADNTGGRAYFNENDLRSLLDEIEEDISNYYILGYRTTFNEEESERRDIRVEVNSPGCSVLTRKTVRTPVPFSNMNKEELDSHMVEGFSSGLRINQLDAGVTSMIMPVSADDLRLAVAVTIPLSAIEQHDGEYNLQYLISVLDKDNEIKSSIHKAIRIPEENIQENQQDVYLVESLQALEGFNKLRIALRDNTNGKRSYLYFNTDQRMPEPDTVVVSQPFFHPVHSSKRIEQVKGVRVERLDKWNEGGSGTDLFLHPELGPVFPEMKPVYKEGDKFCFIAQINRFSEEGVSPDSLHYKVAVSEYSADSEKPELYNLKTDRLTAVTNKSGIGMSLFGEAKIVGWKPGLYVLWIFVSDGETGSTAMSRSTLVITE